MSIKDKVTAAASTMSGKIAGAAVAAVVVAGTLGAGQAVVAGLAGGAIAAIPAKKEADEQ